MPGGEAAASPDVHTARDRIAALSWWHTIEVGPGLVTPGSWDLRRAARKMPWPDLAGARCLDIGTMDGFWAFEMERREAAEVLAIDLTDPARHDPPPALGDNRDAPPPSPSPRPSPRPTFQTAVEVLDSRVAYREMNVYDLRPEEVGSFDLVFVGYALEFFRDPFRALAAIHGVCRGHLIVLDVVSFGLSLVPAPLAKVAARPGYGDWFVFNAAGLRRTVAAAGFEVDAESPWLRYGKGPGLPWREVPLGTILAHTVGWKGCSRAVRGRVRRPNLRPDLR
jgi:tRNA (mo5U34)-methyltransferase